MPPILYNKILVPSTNIYYNEYNPERKASNSFLSKNCKKENPPQRAADSP